MKVKENKILTINSIYSIPLDELIMQVFVSEQELAMLFDYLNYKPSIVENIIKRAVKRILHFQKVNVKLRELKFTYNDNNSITDGISYFNCILKGEEQELRKIAGESKTFKFKWGDF